MPQASAELWEIISKYFPQCEDQGFYDLRCIEFLKSRGYTLTRRWTWIKPVHSHSMSMEEKNCLYFLITEWDFGGIDKND